MTIALAWVAKRSDGREDLYFAADSRTRGVRVLDVSPKILPLPRSDCAICFAGETSATYAFMLQLSFAIAAHGPARERAMDITQLKDHLLRVLTDTVTSVKDQAEEFTPHDAQFILGGYSWRECAFRLWTISFDAKESVFFARPALAFHQHLRQVAFIGDKARPFRSALAQSLRTSTEALNCEPLRLLAEQLVKASKDDTIGGAPQVVRIGPHMNTRPLCVLWGRKRARHLFGRELFDYENSDFWSIDPFTGRTVPPKHFRLGAGLEAA